MPSQTGVHSVNYAMACLHFNLDLVTVLLDVFDIFPALFEFFQDFLLSIFLLKGFIPMIYF